jgi:capsular exopolysaccharide synthesis family protein
MSRIHEALKKAEQDRALAPVPEITGTSPQAPGTAPAARPERTGESLLESPVQTATLAPPSADYLRFDELRSRCAHPVWHPDPNMNVFGSESASPHAAEQFRTLRSRLYQMRNTQTLRTILMTSSVPGEGKTFVTTNLAQSFIRQPDRRALIIDGDLRCARLHVPLGAPNSPGLSDYLRGEVDELAVIQHGQEGNLCFIAGGTEVSDPSELLSNGRLKKLLDRVTPVFDWVIIDSPPCLPVADSTILANYCDGILLVVRAGSTATAVAQRACQELQGRNVIGVVLNAVEQSHMYGSYYYQGYGYGYGYVYGSDGNKTKQAKKN